MPIIHEMEQGSDEWLAIRAGKLTASRAKDAFDRQKNGTYYAARDRYMTGLIIERITGHPAENYVSEDMQFGRDVEDEARAAYQFVCAEPVRQVGFVVSDIHPDFGCSPDGLVADDGMVEIKCPASHTHMDTLLNGTIKPEYIWQMQAQMLVCGRSWCDFVSFDPRMPAGLTMYVRRIEISGDYAALIETEAEAFLAEIADKERRLRERIEA